MALAVINKCSAIINRLPFYYRSLLLSIWRWLFIIDMASAIVNMLTVITLWLLLSILILMIPVGSAFPASGTGQPQVPEF